MVKVGANIKIGRNMVAVHVCPYLEEVTKELKGKWVDACLVAVVIQSLMNI
jgi:hypothetical protein